ncbi:Complement component 1 Q subcomponent-binding protein, partial [Lamprotornis superbus]
DKAFAQFLTDEIQEEKKIQKHKSLPKVSGGWELEVHGTEAKLVRKIAGEKITVTFNINNSIPPSAEEDTQEQQKPDEQEPELTSTPNFVVEVIKDDTKQTLVLDCHFPEDEIGHEGEEESDIFTIREVSFQPTGEADWKDTNYTLNTDSLDWALYDHLMDFLADRGVDNTFADELIELSTALEHQEYIKFLEDLKSFVKYDPVSGIQAVEHGVETFLIKTQAPLVLLDNQLLCNNTAQQNTLRAGPGPAQQPQGWARASTTASGLGPGQHRQSCWADAGWAGYEFLRTFIRLSLISTLAGVDARDPALTCSMG